MSAFIEYFLSRSLFVNLLTMALVLFGGTIALTMNREAFPNIDFDIVNIQTPYPGAAPLEVEKLVTNPIEDQIKEVDGIKEFRSTSVENLSVVTVTIDPDEDDPQKVIDDIRSAVDRTEDLPDDADTPVVIELTSSRTPVIEVSVSRTKKNGEFVLTEKQLRDQAEILEDHLLDIDGVARVARRGWRDIEYQVRVNPGKMNDMYVGLGQIIQAIKNRNVNFPGGEVVENGDALVIRTVGELETVDEIRRVPIRGNDIGRLVRVGDVGRVEENFEEADYIDKTRGYPTISLTVLKQQSADIIDVVDAVKKTVAEYEATEPEGIRTEFVNDVSYYVKRRLGVLGSNAVIGLFLVVGSLFFFMGWRTSLMVALGIPTSVGIAFIVMHFLGVTLNLISMFGLIIVIGILVDDAIIVSENFYRYLEEGYPPFEAARKGTVEVVAPVTATITTTIAAFGPLMFMTGIFGKFVFTIPLVIIIALMASLFECLVILPSHLYDMNRITSHAGTEMKEESGWFYNFRKRFYEPSLEFSLHNKWVVFAALGGMMLVAIGVQSAFGRFVLFPSAIETFHVKLTAEPGTTLETMNRYSEVVEKAVEKLPKEELDTYTTRVGIIQQNPNDPFTRRGNQYAQLLVYLTPENSRERSAQEAIDDVRAATFWILGPEAQKRYLTQRKAAEEKRKENDEPPLPQLVREPLPGYEDLAGTLTVMDMEKLQGGPPVGKPVAIQLTGDSLETLEEIADRYKVLLASIPGVVDIDDSNEPGKMEERIKFHEKELAQTGINASSIAITVNATFDGVVATSVRRPDEEVDIRVMLDAPYRDRLESLYSASVVNNMGNKIPIKKLIYTVRERGVNAISHLDGDRLVTVTANLTEDLTATEAAKAILEKDKKNGKRIVDDYTGYSMEMGGENEDTKESMQSLAKAFGIAVVIIFMILASLFRSVLQPLVVLTAVPFSLIGVILAFALHGEPFSFLAMMGIIGLSGVVVNDSIVLVDFANTIHRENPDLDLEKVAMEAGTMRLRAVFLTTITTVLGLLPTAYGIGGEDPFIVPMALSFAWGLTFSTGLTLIVVPVLYTIITRWSLKLRRVFHVPDREAQD
ncbi:MAG: efflux RND transporter permease subunit [Leptospiraceae bacterium]|nr:efflux RND transporter permease subunit [Leptospiraceae bacterium]